MPEKEKRLLGKYCVRFGKLAVEMGYISQNQLFWAMQLQIEEDLSNKPHKVIGQILFEQGWMTPQQIDRVMNRLFESKEADEE